MLLTFDKKLIIVAKVLKNLYISIHFFFLGTLYGYILLFLLKKVISISSLKMFALFFVLFTGQRLL
jgi:hypothetical protein